MHHGARGLTNASCTAPQKHVALASSSLDQPSVAWLARGKALARDGVGAAMGGDRSRSRFQLSIKAGMATRMVADGRIGMEASALLHRPCGITDALYSPRLGHVLASWHIARTTTAISAYQCPRATAAARANNPPSTPPRWQAHVSKTVAVTPRCLPACPRDGQPITASDAPLYKQSFHPCQADMGRHRSQHESARQLPARGPARPAARWQWLPAAPRC